MSKDSMAIKNSRDTFSMTSYAEKNPSVAKQVKNYVSVIVLALLMALNYEVFILSNEFAPAGINGVATMIQYKMGFSIGYMNLLINIPLCLLAFFTLSKDYSFKTLLFCLSFSGFLLFFKYNINISAYVFKPENTSSSPLAAVAAGVVNGFIYGNLMKINASSGGTDIVSACVRCIKPHLSLSWIIFTINCIVAASSFFVYDCKYEPVIMCIIYSYLTSKVSDGIVRGLREQIKFEIITDNAENVSKEIISVLKHTVTLIPAKGMFSGNETNLLICIINKHQIFELQKILRKYPQTFAYISGVNETVGNFKKIN
ncbi:MAG: YitT family protein [Clostridia bacterium]|nr:YitT family protein [Clostridia bacterium]